MALLQLVRAEPSWWVQALAVSPCCCSALGILGCCKYMQSRHRIPCAQEDQFASLCDNVLNFWNKKHLSSPTIGSEQICNLYLKSTVSSEMSWLMKCAKQCPKDIWFIVYFKFSLWNYKYWSKNQFQRVWSEVYSTDQKIFAFGGPMMGKKFKFYSNR